MTSLTPRDEGLIRNTFLDLTQTTEFLKHPVIFNRAEGLYCWDREGQRYFDAIGGIFVAVLGHRHPRVLEAMRQQMDRMTFAPPLHGVSDVTLDLVEKLATITPGTLDFIKPFSGGSESIESALKFARQYHRQTGSPGKFKFIGRYLGYHGGTFGAMSASGTGKRKSKFEPLLTGFLRVFPPNHYRDRFGSWEECNRFAAQAYGVTPDILCAGKGLASGHIPMGAMAARRDMAEAFVGAAEDEVEFAHGHTFAGNPLACAAALAVIDELAEGEMAQKAVRLGDYLVGRLEGLKQYGVIREIRGKGVLRGVELVRDTQSMDPFPELGRALKVTALRNGLIMRVDPNWFAVSPPFIAEEDDIDEMCDLIDRSLREALEMVGTAAGR